MVSVRLTEEDRRKVSAAVTAAEADTDGEIVTIVAPVSDDYADVPLAWALIVGAATATFPLILTLIGLRARTPEGTASLSAFTQSTGYLIAVIGPFLIGVVHDATGGWTWPLVLLTALSIPLLPLAAYVSRPVQLEDQLDSAVRSSTAA